MTKQDGMAMLRAYKRAGFKKVALCKIQPTGVALRIFLEDTGRWKWIQARAKAEAFLWNHAHPDASRLRELR